MSKRLKMSLLVLGLCVLTVVLWAFVHSSHKTDEFTVVEDGVQVVSADLMGKPSGGADIIKGPRVNDYYVYTTDNAESLENFASSAKGRVITKLFDGLNSSNVTHVNHDISQMGLREIAESVIIGDDLSGLLYGYRSIDDIQHLLYDENILKNFQPHKYLLEYLRVLRPSKSVSVVREGYIIPDTDGCVSFESRISLGGKAVDYLIEQQKGYFLVDQINNGEVHTYKVSFDLKIASPRGLDADGKPYFIWPEDLYVKVEPTDQGGAKDVG